MSPVWGAVVCHQEAHIATDECGAPEFYSGGAQLIRLPGDGAKFALVQGRDGPAVEFIAAVDQEAVGIRPEQPLHQIVHAELPLREVPRIGKRGQLAFLNRFHTFACLLETRLALKIGHGLARIWHGFFSP